MNPTFGNNQTQADTAPVFEHPPSGSAPAGGGGTTPVANIVSAADGPRLTGMPGGWLVFHDGDTTCYVPYWIK